MYWIRRIGDFVNIVSDSGVIPEDEGNRDYQAYLAWVAEGNEAQPWE
jgi:hypothetical protein